jgi:hypothetical protein
MSMMSSELGGKDLEKRRGPRRILDHVRVTNAIQQPDSRARHSAVLGCCGGFG